MLRPVQSPVYLAVFDLVLAKNNVNSGPIYVEFPAGQCFVLPEYNTPPILPTDGHCTRYIFLHCIVL